MTPDGKVILATRALPVRDQVEIWRDAMAKSSFPLEVEPLAGHALEGRAAIFGVGDAAICEGWVSGAVHRRTDGNRIADSILLVLNGRCDVVHNLKGRDVYYRSGQTAVITAATTGEAQIRSAHFLSVCFPRQSLEPLVADVEAAVLCPVEPDNDAARLLRRYLRIMGKHPPSGVTGQLAADHIRDLVALVIGAARDGRELATKGGLAAARLLALKADCQANFRQPDFHLEQLAARSGLSTRSISALFEGDGTTFTDFVRSARLDRAHRLLADPRFDGLRIAAIAYESGFSDLSYFNRCFRRRYGLTPSDFRASLREGA
jgi:AraC-like DNA-binding protein